MFKKSIYNLYEVCRASYDGWKLTCFFKKLVYFDIISYVTAKLFKVNPYSVDYKMDAKVDH